MHRLRVEHSIYVDPSFTSTYIMPFSITLQMTICVCFCTVKASGYSVHSAASLAVANEWGNVVEQNLLNIALDESDYYWPADTLFQYYLLMEALQDNLYERYELLQMLSQAVLAFNDTM